MKILVNHFNYHAYGNPSAEKPVGASLTVPNHTLGLKELLERYTMGGEVYTQEAIFDGDEPVPDLVRMDPMERLDLARSIKQSIKHHQERAPEPHPGIHPLPESVTPKAEAAKPVEAAPQANA